jgi:hypothetical protein
LYLYKLKNGKMKKKALVYFFSAGAAVLLLCTCKKEDPVVKIDTDTTTAYVHAWLEQATSDINLLGMQAADSDTSGILNTCAVITRQKADTANTDTLTIDFGTTGCLCSDGKTRAGKLQFIYDGGKQYKDSTVSINCQPLNYTLDGSLIYGSITITNNGRNGSGNLSWTTNEMLTLNKVSPVGTVTWNASKTVEVLNTSTVFTGYSNAINWSQAWIGVRGSTSGVADDGKSYTATIVSRLEKDLACSPVSSTPRRHPFQLGIVNFQPADRSVRVINYGSGACDVLATITLDGSPYSFGP